jgi:hypothetical protein
MLNLTAELISAVHSTIPMVDIPNPNPVAPPGTTAGISNLIGFAKYGGLIAGVLALIVFGGLLGWQVRQGGGAQVHIGALGGILIGVVIVSAAVSIVGFVFGS